MDILRHVPMLILLLLVPMGCTYNRLSHGHHPVDKVNLQRMDHCEEAAPVHPRALRQILGSAYNEYFMSIDPPQDPPPGRLKRGSENSTVQNHPFFVKEDLKVVLSEEPAWKYDFSKDHVHKKKSVPVAPVKRHHRSVKSASSIVLDAIGRSGDTGFKWHCEAPVRWTDLGKNYFPRYILSVDCNVYECQGTRFKCEPRSFAIKVLRKKEGLCATGFKVHKDTIQMGSDQMPSSLSELWVWEMRANTFCCVCQYK